MKTPRAVIHQIALDAWAAVAVVLTLCLILEAVERGFVSRFFNVLWLVLAVMAASIAVMATHPGVSSMDPAHRPAKGAGALLQLAALLAAAAVWTLLPKELSVVWRAAASGITLLTALSVPPSLMKNE